MRKQKYFRQKYFRYVRTTVIFRIIVSNILVSSLTTHFAWVDLEASQVPNPHATNTMSDAGDDRSPHENRSDFAGGEVTVLFRVHGDLTDDRAICQ